MNASRLGGRGIPMGTPGTLGHRAPAAPTAADRRSEGRLALVVLTAALASIYAISAATVIGRLPATGAVLVGIAGLQAAWLGGTRQLRPCALVAGATLNALLAAIWVLSRTRGLPLGPEGPQPAGVLDTLTAIDSASVALLAWALTPPLARKLTSIMPALTQCAIVLAAASLSSLAAGHTHGSPPPHRAAPANASAPAYYCRLL